MSCRLSSLLLTFPPPPHILLCLVNSNAHTRAHLNADAVFGRVLSGMDVVDQIAQSPTGTQGSFENVPDTPITINSITVADCGSAAASQL